MFGKIGMAITHPHHQYYVKDCHTIIVFTLIHVQI